MRRVEHSIFVRFVDNPEMHIVGLWGWNAGQVEHPESEGFEHSLFAALPETALLDTC